MPHQRHPSTKTTMNSRSKLPQRGFNPVYQTSPHQGRHTRSPQAPFATSQARDLPSLSRPGPERHASPYCGGMDTQIVRKVETTTSRVPITTSIPKAETQTPLHPKSFGHSDWGGFKSWTERQKRDRQTDQQNLQSHTVPQPSHHDHSSTSRRCVYSSWCETTRSWR